MILSFVFFALTCSTGAMLSALPAYVVYVREKRLRKLAQARLMISTAVSEMQELLLEGRIVTGHVCHDELFELMQFVQASETYPLSFNLWTKPSPESEVFALRVEKDLEDAQSPYAQTLMKFINAYYCAFKYRHPVVLIQTYCLLLFSRAFLRLALNAAKLTFKSLDMVESVLKEWHKLKAKKVRRVLIIGTYTRINPEHQMDLPNAMPA